jgi:hypothetical protein
MSFVRNQDVDLNNLSILLNNFNWRAKIVLNTRETKKSSKVAGKVVALLMLTSS